ncbi:hypothetical protein PoB_000742400 [Plakobranchus ocellatus]|uniref:Uncharacterized protein n=1 Tax=Plakobranchus ocellatus TaxID=259542 RepID=A0AAV3YFT8_9GAST|nr:hypothetical protein PoB_000742400 [Plakobranchus ocellatus]
MCRGGSCHRRARQLGGQRRHSNRRDCSVRGRGRSHIPRRHHNSDGDDGGSGDGGGGGICDGETRGKALTHAAQCAGNFSPKGVWIRVYILCWEYSDKCQYSAQDKDRLRFRVAYVRPSGVKLPIGPVRIQKTVNVSVQSYKLRTIAQWNTKT